MSPSVIEVIWFPILVIGLGLYALIYNGSGI